MNFNLHWYPGPDGFLYCCAFDDDGNVQQYRRLPTWGTSYAQVHTSGEWRACLPPTITKRRRRR